MILSIIIPVYNNFKELSSCLKSLQEQTIFGPPLNLPLEFKVASGKFKREAEGVEVIVVDDGSQTRICADPAILRGADLRGQIKFYHIEHGGASAARNFGFSKSSGKYIFFCDADVVFLKKDALEKMIKTLEQNPDKAFCYSSFKFGWKTFKSFPFDIERLKKTSYISTMSMIRGTILTPFTGDPPKGGAKGPFDESLEKFQDWDLWLTIVERGQSGILVPEVLWQAKDKGTMSKWLPTIFYKFKFLKSVKEFDEYKEIVRKKHGLK